MAQALAGLERNDITEIDLHGSSSARIGDDGAKKLAAALKGNSSLTKLTLYGAVFVSLCGRQLDRTMLRDGLWYRRNDSAGGRAESQQIDC